jgi:hypothetical protein
MLRTSCGGILADDSVIQKTVRLIRVFIASPSDVSDERNRVCDVIKRVNERHARGEGILLEPWLWEMDAVPDIGRVQGLINPSLDSAAVFVMILWNRMGSPSGVAPSGTIEEFERALDRRNKTGWPRMLVYYCNRPSNLSEDQLEQKGSVLRFQKAHSSDVLAATYNTPEEFETKLETHLDAVVDEIAAVPLVRPGHHGYRKVLYIQVTHMTNRSAPGATPFYVRAIDRLVGDNRNVPVFDEAVYYTLEMFSDTLRPDPRKDRTSGVLDPRMVVPLRNPLKFSDQEESQVPQTVAMEVNEDCDTLLTVSHFVNGLQGDDQYLASRVAEDAEYLRIIADFSSIPDAKNLVIPGRAFVRTATGEERDATVSPFGDSIYLISCENPKKGELLRFNLSFNWPPAR